MVSKRDKETLDGLDRTTRRGYEMIKYYNTKDSSIVASALRNIIDADDLRKRIKARYD